MTNKKHLVKPSRESLTTPTKLLKSRSSIVDSRVRPCAPVSPFETPIDDRCPPPPSSVLSVSPFFTGRLALRPQPSSRPSVSVAYRPLPFLSVVSRPDGCVAPSGSLTSPNPSSRTLPLALASRLATPLAHLYTLPPSHPPLPIAPRPFGPLEDLLSHDPSRPCPLRFAGRARRRSREGGGRGCSWICGGEGYRLHQGGRGGCRGERDCEVRAARWYKGEEVRGLWVAGAEADGREATVAMGFKHGGRWASDRGGPGGRAPRARPRGRGERREREGPRAREGPRERLRAQGGLHRSESVESVSGREGAG